MGFDIECILNIQSLPGEYFCPVCRTLVYPNEALQTQCTHLYCKPCLAYTVSTTRACPYDGYLVTEADAKPLLEVNKPVAEAIGKIVVHCLYHRSGCQWQGPLTDCINHCNGCSFGNSPVVCNRCGTQIIHRQVQEHAQNCPGVQPQAQTVESGQVASAAETTQTGSQGGVQDSSSQAAASTAAVAAGQDHQGQGNAASQPQSQPQTQSQNQAQTQAQTQPQAQVQAQATAQAMTVEQWQQQQQQYQQYYQQYAGYDPYQQYYQQYGQYPQYAQPHPQPPYVQPQPQVQPHPQPQAQSQAQVQPQPQPQLQPQPQPQSQPLPQVSQPQSMSQQPPMQPQQPPFHVPAQPQPQMPLQAQPILHPQQPHPQQGQPRPQAAVHPQNQGAYYPQNLQPMPQQQYPHPQVPHPQMFPPQSHPQPSQTQPRPHMQQPQPQPNALQPQPARPLAQGVTGHQSYPQPQLQQVPAGGPAHPVMHQGLLPQHPVPGQNQGPPQQPHQMLPPHPQGSVQAMRPPQGPHPNAPHPQQHPSVAHHPVHQPSPQVHHHPGMPPQPQQPFPQPQQQPFPHTQQQPFPQPSQARGPVPQVQQPHGSFPMQHQQHVMHLPQQPLRPQGPYPLQQQQQQPVPAHAQYAQSQNAAGRPMMTMNQAVHQQPLAHPPAQNYMPKSSAHPQMSTVQQQQFQLPRPGSQSQLGASMVAPQTDGFSKQGDSSLENSGKAPGSADGGIGSTELVSAHMDGSKMTDMSDSKTVEDEKNVHHRDVENKPDANGVVEISQMHGKEPKFGVQEDDLDDVAVEQTVKDETTGKDGNSQSSNEEDREKDSLQDAQEIAKDNSQGAEVGSDSSKTQQDKTESLPTSTQAPLQQHVFPAREMVYPHSGYQDRNLHQLSHQLPGHGPNEHSGMPLADHMQARTHAPTAHAVPLAEQERYPQQPMSYGPPMHQRPPAGTMQFAGLGQERRFQEPSLHQVQPQGQPMSTQLRPQVHNFPESLPPHNQMLRQQPPGSFLPEVPAGGYPGPGSIGRGPTHLAPQGQGHALPPHGAPGARPHGQPFGGPLMGGPPPEAINVPASMMGRAPPPHHPDVQMTGPRPVNLIEGERLVSKRPGFFDGRQPDSHMPMPAERVQFGQPSGILPNAMKMNGGPGKGQVGGTHDAAYSHNLPDERFKPLPEERYVSMAEDGINPLTDERFRPFPLESSRRIIDRREFEEDLKQFPRPAHLDGEGASEFENYLSSRPGFGRDAALRPFDRDAGPISSRLIPPHLSGGPSVHPLDIGERSRPIGPHDDILGRKIDPSLAHLDLLRPEFDRHRIENLRHQRSPGREYLGVPPARLGGFPIGVGSRLDDLDMREGRSFGERSRPHGLPPDLLGNPFRESRFPSFPPSGLEMLPGHLRRGEAEIHGNSRFGEHLVPSHLRSGNREDSEFLPGHFRAGEQLGPRGLRDQLRMGEHSGFGGFPGHLRMGDTAGSGSLGSRLRGEMGFGSNFSKKGFPSEVGHHNLGDMDSFEHTRKRKPGSTGWCRICKIDCETVEGLEMHSQTREHQKKAMDIVLSIKKDNAKKQKLSEEHASNEDANKSKQPGSESHGKAH